MTSFHAVSWFPRDKALPPCQQNWSTLLRERCRHTYLSLLTVCHSAQVRRLQELRRYIQEECDQLLLRKERLREEVSSSLHHPHATKQSTHHGKGHRVEEEEEVEEVMVRTVATQAPSSLLGVTHGPSLALSSLAHAYKVDGGCSTHFHSGVPSKELLAMSGL